MNLTEELSRRTRVVLMILFTIIIYVIFFLVVYPELLMVENTYLLIGFISVIGTVVLVYFVTEIRKSTLERERRRREIDRKLRHYESMLAKETHTYHVFEARKEIDILDIDGKARIAFSYRCKNTLDKELEYIRHNIYHDGTLIEESLKGTVNDREVIPEKIERYLTVDPTTREPKGAMPNVFKFSIPCKPKIEPGADFKYRYGHETERVYPKVTEKGAEYTQTLIMHPTDRLGYAIVAPTGYVFDPEILIKVLDRYEVEHVSEENRMLRECPPTLIRGGRIWLWVIDEPKLADIYRLYFSIRKGEPSE